MLNEITGVMFLGILLTVMGILGIGDSEGIAKRQIFWSERDSPASYKAVQKAVVLLATILLVAGISCFLGAVAALILKH
jgi:hypothetical protein